MQELKTRLGEFLTGEALVAHIIAQVPGVYQAALQFGELGEDHTSETIVTFEKLLAEVVDLDFEPSLEIMIKLFNDYEQDFAPAGKVLCNYLLGFIRSGGLSAEQITAFLKQTVVYLKKR